MAFSFPRRLATAAAVAALALPALAQTAAPAVQAAPTAASVASPAVAQAAPDARPAAGERVHRAGHHKDQHKGHHKAHASKGHAKQLTALKGALQLTPAQEAAWTTYTHALQPTARPARLTPDREAMAQLTTPERIDRMRALRAQHAAEADQRGEATKAFYATLSAEQQKTFDAKTHQRHHRMADKGHRSGERHGHPGSTRGAHEGKPTAPTS